MSRAVVVVGPSAISGPGTVDPELAAIALDGIDDELVLVDDGVVPTDRLWRAVLTAACANRRDGVDLVCPSWWPESRLARIGAAVGGADVTVCRRVEVHAAVDPVVELAPELVVVHVDGRRHTVARVGSAAGACEAGVVQALIACVDGLAAVTIDVPVGLAVLGADLARALRRRGVAVTILDDQTMVRAVAGSSAARRSWRRAITPRAAVLAGAVLSATAFVAAAALAGGDSQGSVDDQGSAWLVEGRVAVEVPAQWAVERITTGPGSARVEVRSPTDVLSAIQVTQSRVPAGQTLDTTAATLRQALADEPAGVFVDFAALGQRGQRPVVTYREIRADHHVSWAVLLDGGLRIAIGCQGRADGIGPEQFCDRAIRSAHAVA